MELIDQLKSRYQNGNLPIRLIFICVGIYLLFGLMRLLLPVNIVQTITEWLSLETGFSNIIVKPWTLITYTFLHSNLMHLLFNMIMLYFVGDFFYKNFGDKAFLIFFLGGALCGGLIYALIYGGLFHHRNVIMGSSAAIYSVFFAMVAYRPNRMIRLLFIQTPIKVLHAAIGFLLIGFLLNADNLGGNISHVGGALFGYFYMKSYERGNDFIGNLFKKQTSMKVVKPKKKANTSTTKPPKDDYEYNAYRQKKQAEVDKVLEKISRSGYESLSTEEKEFLLKQGKR